METTSHPRGSRGTAGLTINGASWRGRGSKNKHWPQTKGGADSERWERGGSRGSRGRGDHRNSATRDSSASGLQDEQLFHDEGATEEEDYVDETEEHEHEEADVVDYQELVKAREAERKRAIAEGKMDDPLVPKRLDQAITMVGTCMDMCPRFERYRRERENNLTEWEVIPGTKRVDHKKAVKMYERAAGDKTLPSDLRPPHVLKKTLDYLFHDLLTRGGFNATFSFIRDRSRAVRSDFTMQHEMGAVAIECHDRCARYHILALHFQRDQPGFSMALEEQLLMNTLQSLKEFYEDRRGKYESPTELEMRVYHRLIHIRDQKERHDDIPTHILENPVFKLITRFRQHVQAKSAPITRNSNLTVGEEGMTIFSELAHVLRQEGNTVMIYLVACILERLFGKGAVQDNLEDIRGDLSIPDVIDGKLPLAVQEPMNDQPDEKPRSWVNSAASPKQNNETFLSPNAVPPFETPSSSFPTLNMKPLVPAKSAFSNLVATPNAFGNPTLFGSSSAFGSKSIFGSTTPVVSMTGEISSLSTTVPPNGSSSPFGVKPSPFGGATTSLIPAADETLLPKSSVSATPAEQPSFGVSSATSASGMTGSFHQSTNPSQTNTLFPTQEANSLNPTAPPFFPQSYSPSPFPSTLNKQVSAPATPAQQLQSTLVGNGSISRTLFSTPPTKLPASTVGIQTPTSEQPQGPHNYFVFEPRILSESPSTSSTQSRPPRINTDVYDHTPAASPLQPPLLKRAEPVSLPPTTPSTPTTQQPFPGSNRALKGFPSLQTLSTSADMLSPLHLMSPVASRFPFAPQPESPLKYGSSTILKANGSETSTGKIWSKDEAYAKFASFSARSLIVKDCFARWKKRMIDRAEYLEAVKRSEEYRERVHMDRMLSVSTSASSASGSDRKRRVSGIPLDSSRTKRARKRVPLKYVPPRTDDDLVRRLKENHDEHERRWARGTFLQAFRSHVNQSMPGLSQWYAWLSMNPENDGTAIWLERKFDIPSSGRWVSENVFSISLSSADASLSSSEESPGLIIFECTPLKGLEDELEEKYRILDDCSRLRDVMLAFPADRHYIPSLLLIVWTENQLETVGSDLREMIAESIREKIVKTYSVFSISSSGKDLDQKFLDVISSMQLDTQGELVQPCTGNDITHSFSSLWNDFMLDWVDSCSSDDQFDWSSYGECLQAAVRLLDVMARHVLTVLNSTSKITIPMLPAEDIRDSASAYSSVIAWLDRNEWDGASRDVLQVGRSHKNLGFEFPVTTFHQHLLDLVSAILERTTRRNLDSTFSVLKEELSAISSQFKRQLESENDKLIESRTIRNSRISAKRRPSANSPSPHKRPRTSSTDDEPQTSSLEWSFEKPSSPPSPSPSVATTIEGSSKPIVTVDMLRDLTRSVMKNYGSS